MNDNTTITLTLSLTDLGLVHDALISLPMRKVEPLVTRLRAAAAEAVQAEKPKAAGCGGCQPKTPKEATP